jgi:chromosomal replication initiation ATPase DnaA
MHEKDNECLRIKKAVCEVLEIPITALRKKSRLTEIVLARQLSFYMMHKLNRYSLNYISLNVSLQGHANAIHGIKKIENKIISNDEKVIYFLNQIENKLKN